MGESVGEREQSDNRHATPDRHFHAGYGEAREHKNRRQNHCFDEWNFNAGHAEQPADNHGAHECRRHGPHGAYAKRGTPGTYRQHGDEMVPAEERMEKSGGNAVARMGEGGCCRN